MSIHKYWLSRYSVLRAYFGTHRAWSMFNREERAHILVAVLFPEA